MAFALPRMMGHRGAAALAPENTLAGFAAAKEHGCTWVEFDVMLSGDGVPVLHHDEELGRTARGRGRVSETLLAELQALDAGSHFSEAFPDVRVPTLEQALEALQALDLRPNVELKTPAGGERRTVEAALQVMRRVWPPEREPPLLSAFDEAALAACRDLAPDWPRGLISRTLPAGWFATMRRLDCVSLHLRHQRLTRRRVRAVKAAGYPLAAYTVNSPERARALVAWGVDCLITDAPHLIGPALAGAG